MRAAAAQAAAVALVLLAGAPASALAAAADAPPQVRGVASVGDGDTLSLGPVIVRLFAIDAPEAGQPCGRAGGGTWPCGQRATERLAGLIERRAVRCAVLDRDPYGRLIRRCAIDDAGDEAGPPVADLGALLDREGLAWAFVRYSEDYVALEAEARAAGRGICQGPAETPWDYRAGRWRRAADAAPRPGCPIKGNVNRQGEPIDHTPWSPSFDRTVIDEAQGERWFCDEAEAVAAGWRAARFR